MPNADGLLIMYDDVSAQADFPANADLYAGYDDGAWPDADALQERFPDKRVLRITVNPNDNEGQILDIESGDATPQDSVGWVRRRRLAGATWLALYYSTSLRDQVVAMFAAAGEPLPLWWEAHYDGIPQLSPGSFAKQYQNFNDYDVSVVDPNALEAHMSLTADDLTAITTIAREQAAAAVAAACEAPTPGTNGGGPIFHLVASIFNNQEYPNFVAIEKALGQIKAKLGA